ncbi:unnamed protein product, partial [marine sediment metagenome]
SPASKSTVKFIDSLSNTTEEMYAQLSKEAHRYGIGVESEAESYLRACDLVILMILQNKKT